MEASAVGLAAAFVAGMVSFLSPCVLPLVPAYVSYVAGGAPGVDAAPEARTRLATLAMSAFFALGFSTVFVSLGASATALGGAIVIAFGLLMLGLDRLLPWSRTAVRCLQFRRIE